MDSMSSLFGVIGIGFGVYCFYAYYEMKRTGEINKTILLSKDMHNQQCKNTKAYIAEAGPKVLVMGTGAVIYGAVELINIYLFSVGYGLGVVMALFFALLIWFALQVTKLRKKYF